MKSDVKSAMRSTNISFTAMLLSTVTPPPEQRLLASKPSNAISFSGGGSRSYTVSIGYLLGLKQLDLLGDVRYMIGISGGSWATAAFSYARLNASYTEADLLDAYTPPQNLTVAGLKKMPASARRAVTRTFDSHILEKWVTMPLSKAWNEVMWANFLEPLGVEADASIALDNASAAATRSRNPAFLGSTPFVWPRANRPFPIITASLLGPADLEPFEQDQRRYAAVEMTPLYAGVIHSRNLSFVSAHKGRTRTCAVGGVVQPWAFSLSADGGLAGAATATLHGVASGVQKAHTLREAIGSSSYFPGGYIAGLPVLDDYAESRHYYSPATASAAEAPTDGTFAFADGGVLQDPALIGPLQRRVRSIVLFCNFAAPLASSLNWNPANTTPSTDDLDSDLPAYFGILPTGYTNSSRGYSLVHNQVFASDQFAPVMVALQAAQLRGAGAVATTPLVTVENAYFGIPAGIAVNVTWVYLSRATQWEAQLGRARQPARRLLRVGAAG